MLLDFNINFIHKKLIEINFALFSGYDCGVYVISTAEHLCREFCEGYSINLNDSVTPESVSEKRKQIKDLIYQVADEFGS